ncbi:MAG: M48 family metallopeptidase [Alphaproteobacteria bacterium]
MVLGQYFDGKTAQAHDVRISFAAGGLSISGKQDMVGTWPYDDLTAEAPPSFRETRLRCKGKGTAAIVVVRDADFAAQVLAKAPHLKRAGNKVGGGLTMLLGWGAAIVVAVVAIYFGIGAAAGLLADLVPPELERKWGDAYATGLAGESEGLCAEPAGREALDRLVARLEDLAAAPHPLDVRVVDTNMVNAFALPGGHIVIFSKLIEKADNADELAGVLAHEIGHVAGRDSLRGLMQQIGVAAALGLVFGDTTGVDGSMMTQLVGLSYSRDLELEADRYAADLLTRAGIRRDGLVSFFARLDQEGPSTPLEILSTHPPSDERARLLANDKGGGPAMPADDWAALKTICGQSGDE